MINIYRHKNIPSTFIIKLIIDHLLTVTRNRYYILTILSRHKIKFRRDSTAVTFTWIRQTDHLKDCASCGTFNRILDRYQTWQFEKMASLEQIKTGFRVFVAVGVL